MPLSVVVAGANRHEIKLTRVTVQGRVLKRPEPTAKQPQGVCLDKGYDDDAVRDRRREFGVTAHIRTRGEDANDLREDAPKKARRWVVERTPSGRNRFRRLLVRWDKKPENYLAFLPFAGGLIAFRAAGLFG